MLTVQRRRAARREGKSLVDDSLISADCVPTSSELNQGSVKTETRAPPTDDVQCFICTYNGFNLKTLVSSICNYTVNLLSTYVFYDLQ